jgi:hypothetical protein
MFNLSAEIDKHHWLSEEAGLEKTDEQRTVIMDWSSY